MVNINRLQIGDKVKLNVEAIQSQQNYPKNYNASYVEWVEANKHKIFTLSNRDVFGAQLELEDDNAIIKWTFWEGHLTKAEVQNEI